MDSIDKSRFLPTNASPRCFGWYLLLLLALGYRFDPTNSLFPLGVVFDRYTDLHARLLPIALAIAVAVIGLFLPLLLNARPGSL